MDAGLKSSVTERKTRFCTYYTHLNMLITNNSNIAIFKYTNTTTAVVPWGCSCLPAPQDGGSEQIDAMLTLAYMLTAGASMACS